MNQEVSEQNEVDGMKMGADSTPCPEKQNAHNQNAVTCTIYNKIQ